VVDGIRDPQIQQRAYPFDERTFATAKEAADLIVSLRKELEEARVKALEEAALLIDNCEYVDLVYPETMSDERDNIAAAIRALKDKQP
jgi:hypothetical protein